MNLKDLKLNDLINLKDLKLKDLIKIAGAVTISIILTLNLSIASNNSTVINNYIQESNEKLDVIQKVNDQQASNITKVKSDVNQTLIISKQILKEVD